ncbi:MAG: protoporphyrinogen oxidase [Janthinobacterium lividum]
MTKRIAVVGGGMAGLAAAYELTKLQRHSKSLSFTLIEASERLGGILETRREDGFVFECGPDAWVTDKPWAREVAEELGLAEDLLPSNDGTRITYVLQHGRLQALPDNMRMMVPENLDTVRQSAFFSPAARDSYLAEPARAEELKASAPDHDESVASFVSRHFGEEVLRVIGAPLLGGVFGGNVYRLSVRAVMAPFVQMEREYGSLILALQARAAQRGPKRSSIFTTLRGGTGTLAERMAATLPQASVQLNQSVIGMQRTTRGWLLQYNNGGSEEFDYVLLAVPVKTARKLLEPLDARSAELVNLPTSSAVIAAFGYAAPHTLSLPAGFGFLAPESEHRTLLAATFADQKFESRVPQGGKSLRAYFGGANADALIPRSDEEIAAIASDELARVLGPLPLPAATVVRRWPDALPQYEVGHGERMAELQSRVDSIGALHLLGNGYRGVGLPDLIRDGLAAARSASQLNV